MNPAPASIVAIITLLRANARRIQLEQELRISEQGRVSKVGPIVSHVS